MAAKRKEIILGVTGSIAAYKACDITNRLKEQGFNVNVVMTDEAKYFISPLTLQHLSGNKVVTEMFELPDNYDPLHTSLADKADLILVAPATANMFAKVAHGICDDLLSTTLCACWAKPTIFAPAMNNRMWENPAVQANVETLTKRGVHLVGPEEGRLAWGDSGPGRMSEPRDIMDTIEKIASKINKV